MRWIKHVTTSRRDERVAKLVSIGGHALYGLWWMVLETVGESIEKGSSKCSLTYPVSQWSVALSLRGSHVRHSLEKLALTGLLTVEWNDPDVTVTIPNLLKYRDEYSSRVGRKARETPDQEAEVETDTEAKAENTPQPPKAVEVLSPLEAAISEVAARLCARHPPKRSCTKAEAEKQLRGIVKKIPSPERIGLLQTIDENHRDWCETASWRKEAGEYAKGLFNWLAPTMRRWADPPPGEAYVEPVQSKLASSMEQTAAIYARLNGGDR